MTDDEIDQIERRLRAALEVAPAPWVEHLEARDGFPGESFVACGVERDVAIYVQLHPTKNGRSTPDKRHDAVVDFIGNAAGDVRALIDELRRARAAMR